MHFFIVKKPGKHTDQISARGPEDDGMDQTYRSLKSRYLPIITNYIVKNNGTPEDAEDIFHDALIVYIHKLDKSELRLKCKPATFLFAISRNLWMKKLRRRSIHNQVMSAIKVQLIEEPVEEFYAPPTRLHRLKRAFADLPCPCRRLLNFFYFHKKRYDEIIDLMGISNIQVAKNQKLRCMKKLRNQLLKKLYNSEKPFR